MSKSLSRILVPALMVIAFAVIGNLFFRAMDTGAKSRSPSLVWTQYEQPGSGHAFGFNIVYTVVRHDEHDGQKMAVCTSHERGVEIWSPIPDLVKLQEGSQFQLSKAKSWSDAFKVVRLGP